MVIIHRLQKQKQKMEQLRFSVWLLSAVLFLILVSSESKQQSLSPNKQLKNALEDDTFLGLEGGYFVPTSEPDESLTDYSTFRALIQQHLPFGPLQYDESRASNAATELSRSGMDFNGTTSETEIDPDMSCIGPDQNECGKLELYGCEQMHTYSNRSNVNVSDSCREDEYARLERANVLRCATNLSELRSRLELNLSLIGDGSLAYMDHD